MFMCTYASSREKSKSFYRKSELQMLLLISGGHICVQKLYTNGQHSLTSVERPFHLRSDFVNVWRHARLVVYILYLWPEMYASASIVYSDLSDDLMFVSRSCLAFSIIPRLIQTRSCHCLRLKDVLKFQASSFSAGWRTFHWMLLNNILWMAPDNQARWQLYIITFLIEYMYSVDSVWKSPYLYFTFEEKDQYCYLFNNIYLYI